MEVQRSVRPRQHQPGPQEGKGGGGGGGEGEGEGGGQGEHQQLHAEGSHRLESEGGYSQAAAAAGMTPIQFKYMTVNCDNIEKFSQDNFM